ncbi:septal ring lytic transglycosylase RlpA family protein [Telluribacter sp.]|jgi:rare lipoprotein A|uniref:septal ring lytic transglycosylase RlpA family protein n=1 Tax=Telluribacter sp. TaxID=1978767 RepID=UPI002E10E9BC|nr:septal ring lytic transglycosylase RlpA family protein [Telluribacter sp.]
MKSYLFLLFICLLSICSTSLKAQADLGETQQGRASFYSTTFDGNKTYFGEIFNSQELTAAHRSLPHNTMVEVTNLTNKRSVIVRINDRGPFTNNKNRLIDVSKAAAGKLGLIGQGVAEVVIRVIGMEGMVLLAPHETVLKSTGEIVSTILKKAVKTTASGTRIPK